MTRPGRDDPATTSTSAAVRLKTAWAERVVANRDQAERLRETRDQDHYAPVSNLFVADPRRTDEPALDSLLAIAGPGQTWLDIGAGAGRYALPLALRVGHVIAVEPSAGMRQALHAGIEEHGLDNVRVVAATWPEAFEELGPLPVADTALIAHVGYDIEDIGPFLDAMEAASRTRCVAMLADASPSSVVDALWPPIHGEERVALPAMPELLALLRARGREPQLTELERIPRTFETPVALEAYLRRQLFLAADGAKARRLQALLPERIARRDGGWALAGQPAGRLGIATWEPRQD